MEVQCDRLVAMAGELLEFSRGETKLHLEHTDTSALMRQFIAFNDEAFRPVGITFSVEDEPAEVEVDPMRLQRVLQNLVSNAVQALNSKPGGRIDVRAWVADSMFYYSVGARQWGRAFRPTRSGTGFSIRLSRTEKPAERGLGPGDREECGRRASREDHV